MLEMDDAMREIKWARWEIACKVKEPSMACYLTKRREVYLHIPRPK